MPYSEETIAWPTEKGNFHRTGLYGEHWRIMPVEEGHSSPAKPSQFNISAYPNPFNSSVTISLDFGSESAERLSTIEVFDVNGRRVGAWRRHAQPAFATVKPLREGEFVWRPDESVGSGVYLVRTRFAPDGPSARLSDRGEQTVTRRVVYLK